MFRGALTCTEQEGRAPAGRPALSRSMCQVVILEKGLLCPPHRLGRVQSTAEKHCCRHGGGYSEGPCAPPGAFSEALGSLGPSACGSGQGRVTGGRSGPATSHPLFLFFCALLPFLPIQSHLEADDCGKFKASLIWSVEIPQAHSLER